ncbi:TIGR04086 family membrane protein [Clostridium sp. Sa3CUN1]|uniref:TIGR04086 family membrane protein n=1 Tax=Clostridium gallinarum TaxID=2762246 RepID=A0ABR8Q3N3_9CLOT|nr:TIGR04086 family membrane protein [Clostridium gallinarum]MBD7915012.1 TIGR04086 family membrane protein [Clostridium gallinarum]
MEWISYFKSVLKGLVWALVITIVATIIFSFVMNKFPIGEKIFNIIYVVISCLALVLGSVVAVKSYGSKGWIVGLAVGCIFYIVLYFIGIIFGAEATLTIYDFIKFTLCIFIGLLSGMLGINL